MNNVHGQILDVSVSPAADPDTENSHLSITGTITMIYIFSSAKGTGFNHVSLALTLIPLTKNNLS